MPGSILDQSTQVSCGHPGGFGRPFPALVLRRVTTMGKALVGEVTPYPITGCTNQVPCALALNWTGAATRVTAMGVPVLVTGSLATCIPTQSPALPQATPGRVLAT